MLKIVATISNCGVAANVGGDVDKTSEIIDIPTSCIPPNLRRYLKEKSEWETVVFSLLLEEGAELPF